MILERFLLKDYQDTAEVNHLEVPADSIFIKALALEDGLYAFYAVNRNVIVMYENEIKQPPRVDTYVLVKVGADIPPGSTPIDILSIVVEEGGKQGTFVFSIFKLKDLRNG